MINHLYHGNYVDQALGKDNEDVASSRERLLPLHAQAYSIGEKYLVDSLMNTASYNFSSAIGDDPDLVLSPSFREAIEIVYTCTTESKSAMRSSITNLIRAYPKCLDQTEFTDLLKSIPDLSLDMALSYREKQS